jgi:chromosome segregation ATPase
VIFLILKMFVYLLLALLAGVGAGWVLRHIAAAKQEEDMQRTLADARARVPQFESLIRSRDEQIKRLKEELKDKDVRINGLVDDFREAELALKDKDRELKEFTARHETLADLADEGTDGNDNGGELLTGDEALNVASGSIEEPNRESGTGSAHKEEISRLEVELRDARAQAADAMAEAAAAEAEVITLKATLARAGEGAASGSSEAVAELEARLQQKSEEHDRLAQALESEQRRVMELERERELQNKSLRVLHQQLELEKERGQRAAAG